MEHKFGCLAITRGLPILVVRAFCSLAVHFASGDKALATPPPERYYLAEDALRDSLRRS